jgi:hypothetical protein
VSGKAAKHVTRLIGLLGLDEALAQAIASSLYSRILEALRVAQWGGRPPSTERLSIG